MTVVKNGERICVSVQINSSRNKQNKINCRSHCSSEFPWPVSDMIVYSPSGKEKLHRLNSFAEFSQDTL